MEPPDANPTGPEQPATRARTIPREQDAPRSLILLMIGVMLLAVGLAYYWIERSGMAEQVMGRPAPLAHEGPISSLEQILAETAKANLLGRDVTLWDAPVTRVSGDWLFWLGSDDGAVPVVLLGEQTARQGEQQTVVREGDRIAVFGVVRAVRNAAFLDEPWALRSSDRQRIERSPVYISAMRVEHLRRRP